MQAIELSYPLTVGDVARVLGRSTERIRQLDDELHPVRTAAGQRRYSVDAVQRFAAKRAPVRGAR